MLGLVIGTLLITPVVLTVGCVSTVYHMHDDRRRYEHYCDEIQYEELRKQETTEE